MTSPFFSQDQNAIFADLNQEVLNQVLLQVWQQVQLQLTTFANQSAAKIQQGLELAFGDEFEREKAHREADLFEIAVINNWQNNNWEDLPPLEFISSTQFNGAFSRDTGKIYLSKEFFAGVVSQFDTVEDITVENDSFQELVAVLIEEIGHSVEAQLNEEEIEGDEGAVFSALVMGESLIQSQLQQLRNEDDLSSITIGDQNIHIETAFATIGPIFFLWTDVSGIRHLIRGAVVQVYENNSLIHTGVTDENGSISFPLLLFGDAVIDDSRVINLKVIATDSLDLPEASQEYQKYLIKDPSSSEAYIYDKSVNLSELRLSSNANPSGAYSFYIDQPNRYNGGEILNSLAGIFNDLESALAASSTISSASSKILLSSSSELNLASSSTNNGVFGTNLPILGDVLAGQNTTSIITNIRSALANLFQPDLLLTAQEIADQLSTIPNLNVTVVSESENGVEFALDLDGTVNLGSIVVPADLGLLDQFGLSLDTSATVDLTYNLDGLKFGVNQDQAYVAKDDSDLEITVDISLPSGSLEGHLGCIPIAFNLSDAFPDSLEFDFKVDLGSFNHSLDFSQLANIPLFEFDFNLPDGAIDLPAISGDLTLNLAELGNLDFSNPNLDYEIPFSFDDLTLDLGSLYGDFLGPALGKINAVFEPIRPLISILNLEIPLVSQLSDFSLIDFNQDGQLTFRDLVEFEEIDFGLIDTILEFGNFITSIPSNGGLLNLGDINIDGIGSISTAPLSVSQPSLNLPSGFNFNLLDNPFQFVYDLILGTPTEVFTYRTPSLDFNIKPEVFVPILGPFFGIRIGGNFGANMQFGFGFDTYGLTCGDTNHTFEDGFYVTDTINLDGTGADIPEATLTAGLSLDGGVDIELIKAFMGGDINGEILINLKDTSPEDGKIRFSEIPFSNPSAIFDPITLNSIYARLDAWFRVGIPGLSYSTDFPLSPQIPLINSDQVNEASEGIKKQTEKIKELIDIDFNLIKGIQDFIDDAGNFIRKAWDDAGNFIKSIVSPDGLIQIVSTDQLGKSLTQTWTQAGDYIEDLGDGIVKTWTQAGDYIEDLGDGIVKTWTKAGDYIEDLGDGIVKTWTQAGDYIEDLGDGIVKTWTKAGDYIEDLGNGVITTLTKAGDYFKDLGNGAITSLTNAGDYLVKGIDGATTFLSAQGEFLTVAADFVAFNLKGISFSGAKSLLDQSVVTNLEGLGNQIGDGITDLSNQVGSLTTNVANEVSQLTSQLGNQISNELNKVADLANEIFEINAAEAREKFQEKLQSTQKTVEEKVQQITDVAQQGGEVVVNTIQQGGKELINIIKPVAEELPPIKIPEFKLLVGWETLAKAEKEILKQDIAASKEQAKQSERLLSSIPPQPNKPEKPVFNLPNLSGYQFLTQESEHPGNAVTISYLINSYGSRTYNVDIYLSTDEQISTEDKYLGTKIFTPGDFDSYNDSYELPNMNDPFWKGSGTYYIGMVIDPDNLVIETNENDNSSQGVGIDYQPIQIILKPDLLSTSFNILQSSVNFDSEEDYSYEYVDIEYEFKNNTGLSFPQDAIASFYLSLDSTIDRNDWFLGSSGVLKPPTFDGSLPPLINEHSGTFRATLPPLGNSFWNFKEDGEYYIGMILDSQDEMEESNENNNSNLGLGIDYDQVSVSGTNNRVQGIISYGSGFFDENEITEINISSSLSSLLSPQQLVDIIGINQYSLIYGEPFTLPSGAILTTNSDGSFFYNPNGKFEHLKAGETTTDRFLYKIKNDQDEIEKVEINLTIDGVNDSPLVQNDSIEVPENSLYEGNLLTNDSDIDGDNLEIIGFTNKYLFTEYFFVPEKSFTLPDTGALLTLRQDGTFSLDPNGRFSYLAPGETKTENFFYTVSDNNGSSQEAEVTLTITGVPSVDLTGGGFNVLSRTPMMAEDNFNVNFVISNRGDNHSGSFKVDFYLSLDREINTSDKYLGNYLVNEGVEGNTNTGWDNLSANLTLPSLGDSFWQGDGTYYIGMIIDSENQIIESHENNNANSSFIYDDTEAVEIIASSVRPPNIPPDLIGLSLDRNPGITNIKAGESTGFSFYIKNTGEGNNDVEGNYRVEFYLSSDQQIGEGDFYFGSYEIENDWGFFETPRDFFNLPERGHSFWQGDGEYYLGMIIDPDNSITEINEDNNTFVSSRPYSVTDTILPLKVQPDLFTLDEDSIYSANVIDNDIGATLAQVTKINGDVFTSGSTLELPSGSLLTISQDGHFTYDPNGKFDQLNIGKTATDSFTYTLSDGEINETATVIFTINGVNDIPKVQEAIADQIAIEDQLFSFTLPNDLFSDIDAEDTLTYSASISTAFANIPLPNWLSFDSENLLFSGIPTNSDVGLISIQFVATDTEDQRAKNHFTLTVENTDDPPIIVNGIVSFSVDEDAPSDTINVSNVFNDVDGDAIKLSVTNDNEGLVTATLNNQTLILDYLDNQSGKATITLTGTANNQSVNNDFTVTVNPVDDAPTVENAIADVTVDEDAENTIIDLNNIFTDIDNNDAAITKSVLVNSNETLVTATIVNNELTLDYLPNQSGTANITIQGESNGQTVENTFTVTVNPIDEVNEAPTVDTEISNQKAEVGESFNLDISSYFSDSDHDLLTFSADGLPDGLSIDPSGIINGTPTQLAVGFNSVTIIADDGNGGTVSDIFELTVFNEIVVGTDANNRFLGTSGNDLLDGGDGKDFLRGRRGDDVLNGDSGKDFLHGGLGDDILHGGSGNDILNGGSDKDFLRGGRGDDLLHGGSGNDILNGGRGNDIFVLAADQGTDRIIDFKDEIDLIGLSGTLTFSDLSFSGNQINFGTQTLAIVTGIDTTTLREVNFLENGEF